MARIVWIAGAALVLVATSAFGAPPPTALDKELLDDLQPALPRGTNTPPAPPAGEDLGAVSENPLAKLHARMLAVSRRIAGGDTSSATQLEQQQIAEAIAALIQQLRTNPRNAASSAQSSATQSGEENSETARGESETPTKETSDPAGRRPENETPPSGVTAGKSIWGHLPRRVREQIQSSAIEEFLPKYQDLIEAYYRRLAEDPEPTPRQQP